MRSRSRLLGTGAANARPSSGRFAEEGSLTVATTLSRDSAASTVFPAEPRAPARPTGWRGTLVTVAMGETLVQLGLAPITAVLPGLAEAVGVSAADGAWLLTVYILALAGTLLVAGRLGDLLGHRRIFGLGALVYAGATAAGGLAPGFGVLLATRVAQGVGAA